jgi:hypothetical protein
MTEPAVETEVEEAGAESTARWDGWLGPRTWIPAALVLIAAVGGLFGLYLMERGNSGSAAGFCPPGTPGCELRQPIHEHADFAVFIRGERLDFSNDRYISTEERELSENIHIHNPRHTVVHIHREQTTWDEFFRSLGFELNDPSLPTITPETTCLKMPDGTRYCASATETFKFYVNGVKVDGIANHNISDLDRVLLSFGSETEEEVLRQFDEVTDEACIPSARCRERGDPDYEPCSVTSGVCN